MSTKKLIPLEKRSLLGHCRVRIVFSLVLLSALVGCQSANLSDLSPREAASTVNDLRKQADDCLAVFERSRGRDLEALECYAEKNRLTTEIYSSPSLCPNCFYRYGLGLRYLGNYQVTLRGALERRLEETRGKEAEDVRAAISRADSRAKEYYAESNKIFGIYLSSPGFLERDVYRFLAEQHFELGNHEAAVRNLEKYIELVRADASSQALAELERLRRSYQAAWDRARLGEAVERTR